MKGGSKKLPRFVYILNVSNEKNIKIHKKAKYGSIFFFWHNQVGCYFFIQKKPFLWGLLVDLMGRPLFLSSYFFLCLFCRFHVFLFFFRLFSSSSDEQFEKKMSAVETKHFPGHYCHSFNFGILNHSWKYPAYKIPNCKLSILYLRINQGSN